MLTLVGTSHRDAPLEVREHLAIGADNVPLLLDHLHSRFGACAVLNTCNRFEIYLAGDHEREEVTDFVAAQAGLDGTLAHRYFHARRDVEAVEHIYAVAAGIESMVIGEPEILGQVRQAFSISVATGVDDALLSRLFHTALRVGRRARVETGIGRHALSVSSIAVHEALALHNHLEDAKVLVIGAGEAGRAAAEGLIDRGASDVTVVNRTGERAEALAADLGARVVSFGGLLDAVGDADIVITASGSAEHLVSRQGLEAALRSRGERPLLIIDIAVPRDFDPEVRWLPGVVYRDLDDLQRISESNGAARASEVEAVRSIVRAEAERFRDWWELLDVVPTIAELTERAERMRVEQLERTLRSLRPTEDVRQQLDALTRALVRQILHDPIRTLRQRGDRDEYVSLARSLFALDDPTAPVPTIDSDTVDAWAGGISVGDEG